MTSREALREIDDILCNYRCRLKPDNCLYCEDNNEDKLLDIIERDINLIEALKRVLSKVTRLVHLPEIISKENENGFVYYYLKNDLKNAYKIGEDFDVEFFKEIIDQLGFELVKKEDK